MNGWDRMGREGKGWRRGREWQRMSWEGWIWEGEGGNKERRRKRRRMKMGCGGNEREGKKGEET